MKFAFIPTGQYKIGQIIEVHGRKMQVEGPSPRGQNLVAVTLPGAPRMERILCILTDAEPVVEMR